MKDCSYLFNLLAYCSDRLADVCRCSGMAGRSHAPGDAPSPAVISDSSPEVQVTRCYLEKFKKACDEKHAQLLVAYIPGQAELGEDDCSFTEDLSLPEQIGYRKAFFRCADQPRHRDHRSAAAHAGGEEGRPVRSPHLPARLSLEQKRAPAGRGDRLFRSRRKSRNRGPQGDRHATPLGSRFRTDRAARPPGLRRAIFTAEGGCATSRQGTCSTRMSDTHAC